MLFKILGPSERGADCRKGKNLEGKKFEAEKFGGPPSDEPLPSIPRMLCAQMCAQDIAVTIQNPPGNNISHPEPTEKQQQGTLYQICLPFLRGSTNPAPLIAPPPKKKTSHLSPPPPLVHHV